MSGVGPEIPSGSISPEALSGSIGKVLHENTDSGYGVLLLETREGTVRACGLVPFPMPGEILQLNGSWVQHPEHGRQFAFAQVRRDMPSDLEGIRKLLAGMVKALGPVALHRVLERYREDSMRLLLEDPLQLTEIPGIMADKALTASQEAHQVLAYREIAQWLSDIGLAPDRARKAVTRFGVGAPTLIREDPYCLLSHGVDASFLEADKAASACGIKRTDARRIRAAATWLLRNAMENGNSCMPENLLLTRLMDMLSHPEPISEDEKAFIIHSGEMGEADHMFVSGRVENVQDPAAVCKEAYQDIERFLVIHLSSIQRSIEIAEQSLEIDQRFLALNQRPLQRFLPDEAQTLVYLPEMQEMERRVSDRILALQHCSFLEAFSLHDGDWAMLEELAPWGWDEGQRKVFRDAGSHGVTVITGGPGTGKTTLIRGLVRLFQDHGFELALSAPTGRAARRMADATGLEARTLHRLLEVAYDVSVGDTPRFRRNAEDPLEAGVVIVDEASMLDLAMFDALLQACADGTRLILVGDAEQLPSVGAGRVLGDLIDCGILPVTRLRQVFRQSDGSRIAANAQGILEGRFPEFSDEYGEFHLVRRFKAAEVAQTVVRLCQVELPERYGFDPYADIQVLSPMRKGAAGVENLNRLLQEALNPPTTGRGAKRMVSSFREGDRVMQNRNDYRLAWTQLDREGMPVTGEGVYNGDMGTLIEVNPKTRVSTVLFDDGRQAEYGFEQLEGLEQAYAVTVHKSQGSEYPVVVLPLAGLPDVLACRNLLYTAITRARRMVVMVGAEAMLERMIRNTASQERHSGLARRLEEGAANAKQ